MRLNEDTNKVAMISHVEQRLRERRISETASFLEKRKQNFKAKYHPETNTTQPEKEHPSKRNETLDN